ncbi:unnamed protein product [Caenorhabditis angaria]|uniref:Uncharacterized protein n=1 Tax=Caenorhabditis angaria TaxID=860376 RepID=A0A9P1J473_9PELO|nr:unnamed protein product [Caenorhabditis angaria]
MMSNYPYDNNQDSYNKNNQNYPQYQQTYSEHQLYESEYSETLIAGSGLAGVPMWAIWSFVACAVLIVAVLLLDYCVIRRNALGNTCCTRARQKRGTANAAHQKRSTNMLLNV